ncbi:hypothetical protein BS47DRAFT_1373169 [Hydnum rufescens UP504]|uniref:Origin recognition complex subunit 1 n=1 Tax=Hydnum rufescens UP504 TaxID=1448309 RepID=A0A9P6ASF9_9AGAM|nr:hypothetical protein BS47DRAFT_1373169 [Hydnum rufescens UP504]
MQPTTPRRPRVRVHWFVQPREMARVRAHRDHAANEIYYSLNSSAVISPSDLLDKCFVTNTITDRDDTNGRTFSCLSALDSVQGIFYVFDWNNHRAQVLQGPAVDPGAWKRRDRGGLISKYRDEDSQDDDDMTADLKTPTKSRKRVRGAPSSSEIEVHGLPASVSRTSPSESSARAPSPAAPTPHSKAALKARVETKRRRISQQVASQNTFTEAIDLGHLPKDARLRAMHVLHVGSRPEALPCREEEYTDILAKVLELLEEGAGGCLYISGVPGTGKTATRMAERGESNPFTYVEVNGLKIPEPSAAYGVLWGAFVVLMDELDQLVTKKQDVVYNFFNWPSLANSKLIVLAVANTMDLPERVMSGKVRSRLGMERVDFRPYSRSQLETIVNSRLVTATDGLEVKPQEVMDTDAVKFAAMKVSAISGDARRVLDICRRAVEVSHARNKAGPVGAKDVGLVITEMQNSPTAAYLRECSFHERIMLAATWKCLKRVGVSVIKWSECTELTLVLDSLTAARALLIEDPRKGVPDGDRKIMLNLEETEMLRVLGEWSIAL